MSLSVYPDEQLYPDTSPQATNLAKRSPVPPRPGILEGTGQASIHTTEVESRLRAAGAGYYIHPRSSKFTGGLLPRAIAPLPDS